MTEVVIAGAVRTPVGAFNGGLSTVPASYLGTVAIKEDVRRAKVEAGEVDEVVMGQILTAGKGKTPERQEADEAGLLVATTAHQINQIYGTGLSTLAMGSQTIDRKNGVEGRSVAGSVELGGPRHT